MLKIKCSDRSNRFYIFHEKSPNLLIEITFLTKAFLIDLPKHIWRLGSFSYGYFNYKSFYDNNKWENGLLEADILYKILLGSQIDTKELLMVIKRIYQLYHSSFA